MDKYYISEGEALKKLFEEIVKIYQFETLGQFPYEDFRQLKEVSQKNSEKMLSMKLLLLGCGNRGNVF